MNNLKIFSKKNLFVALLGSASGFINGLLGAGGGMVTVPLLKKIGFNQKQAQANAIAVILPITIISAWLYWHRGYVVFSDALPYIPGGFIGAFLGTKLLKKLSNKWLKKIFGIFMLWAGLRLLMR